MKKPSTTVCRLSNGICDDVDYCDGYNNECPNDKKKPTSTICRPKAGVCDEEEFCDGYNNNCPSDSKESNNTLCRAVYGPCDVAEYCDGYSNDCPFDEKKSKKIICRPKAGECDIAEYCNGKNNECPNDFKKSSNHVCRPARGICDEEDYCDGYANDCPTDLKKPNTTVCRIAVSECDKTEYCTGTSNKCPPNKFRKENFPCSVHHCNESKKCTYDDYCNGYGVCLTGKLACPEPALKDGITIYKQWNPSGKLVAFSAKVNGESSIVIQWTGYTGYKVSGAHLYIDRSKPTSTDYGTYPYSFTSSTHLDKFQMVVPTSSISYNATCDNKYYIALEIDTIAGINAVCGLKKTNELDYCQNSEGISWLKGSYSISSDNDYGGNWGAWYSKVPFCCCFDSNGIYDSVAYKTIIFSYKNQAQNVKRFMGYVSK
jgi:hypothetical protein